MVFYERIKDSWNYFVFLQNKNQITAMNIRLLLISIALFAKCMLGNIYGQSVTESGDSVRYWIIEGVKSYRAGEFPKATDLLLKVYDGSRNDSVVCEDVTQIGGMLVAEYAVMLDSLANYNYEYANYEIALLFGEKALDVNRVVYGKDSPSYAKSLSLLAKCLYEQAHYTESMELITEALNIQEKCMGKKNSDYADYLMVLADNHLDLGIFEQSIKIGEEAISIIEEIEGKSSVSYAKIVGSLADYYYEYGKATKASQLCEYASHIYEKEGMDYTVEYATILFIWAKCKSDQGYDKEAIIFGQKALDVFQKTYGIHHPSRAAALSLLGVCNSNIGNNEKAIRLNLEAINIYKEIYNDEHPIFAILFLNLSSYYCLIERYDDAISSCLKCFAILKNSVAADHPYIAILRHNQALIYMDMKEYDNAIFYAIEALSIYEKGQRKDLRNAFIYSIIAECYSYKGNNIKAIEYGKEALNVLMEVSSMNDFWIANLLDNISHYYSEIGMYQESTQYIEKASERFKHYCLHNFSEMSNNERYIIGVLLQQRFKYYLGFAYRCNLPQITSMIYDYYTLFAKGILLNTEINIKELIKESGDSLLLNKYDEYVSNKEIFNKLISLPVSERHLNLDSLNNTLQQQEEYFAEKVLKDNDILQLMNITWNDIQSSLQEDEIAVEFIDIPLKNDSVIYAALTIKSEYDEPKMTPLFEYRQLKSISDTLYYQCEEMADLVWKPLQKELQGVKNIYFSPSGVLYNIGIEYLPGMDEYNIYRLSSTRELVTRKESETGTRAVLYGGLDYYADLDTLNSSRSLARISETFGEHADVRGLSVRGAQNNLEYTQEEVENIGTELQKGNWTCLLDTMSMGTEESFKSLSGKGINTIHIATHGFYYTQEDADYKGYRFMLLDDNRTSAEDKALTRSGLLMSGANHILEGENLPDNVEDGILTAKEIANVDLRGLDLVVLSACQTGLGDISQGEGVFGLQRGFKKAGANSILMSLWEVDDKATQILMTQFYKNWLSGQSKHQSLLSAQKFLRETEGGKYNEPKYWAAFILLDGLN